jgi:hypothetical protein
MRTFGGEPIFEQRDVAGPYAKPAYSHTETVREPAEQRSGVEVRGSKTSALRPRESRREADYYYGVRSEWVNERAQAAKRGAKDRPKATHVRRSEPHAPGSPPTCRPFDPSRVDEMLARGQITLDQHAAAVRLMSSWHRVDALEALGEHKREVTAILLENKSASHVAGSRQTKKIKKVMANFQFGLNLLVLHYHKPLYRDPRHYQFLQKFQLVLAAVKGIDFLHFPKKGVRGPLWALDPESRRLLRQWKHEYQPKPKWSLFRGWSKQDRATRTIIPRPIDHDPIIDGVYPVTRRNGTRIIFVLEHPYTCPPTKAGMRKPWDVIY